MMNTMHSPTIRPSRAWLIGLHAFNGLCAIAGGLALMSGWIDAPEWVAHTSFPSLYFPGVVLFAAAGGSAIIAAISLYKRLDGAELLSISAGVIMIWWILGEIMSIRAFHWLQVIYLLTGLAVISLTKKETVS